MSQLTFHLLGAPEVRLDDQPVALKQRKALALLAYLAVTGEFHQRETLSTLFWPEHNGERGRANLRRTLWLLKQTLGDGWLETEGERIGLHDQHHQAKFWVDVVAFQRLLAQSGEPSSSQVAALEALEQAVVLYRGDFLAGFTLEDSPAFDDWQFFEAETARQAMTVVLDKLVQHYGQVHAYDAAIGHARRRLALDPLHEPAHQSLMRLYAFSGRQAAALRQFDECQRILADELGVEADDETQALATAIREKRLAPVDKTLTGSPMAESERTPPTPSALGEDQPSPRLQAPRSVFVGRQQSLGELDVALAKALAGQGQLRIITGEAGAGKTALITEFLYQAQSKQPDLIVTSGASDAQTGSVDPFLPFREALLALLRASAPDQSAQWNPAACLALMEQGPNLVDSFIPPADLPAVIAHAQAAGWQGAHPPPNAAALGQPAIEQSKLIEQYVAFLGVLAAQCPLVVVLEDLHWADAASLGLLFRLGRQVEANRLLILGSYRTEQAHLVRVEESGLEKLLHELQRQQGKITIDLEAVRLAEGRALVDGLLDTEPNQLNESFRQALYQQTGGHPLFVVELLNDLKASTALMRDRAGRWVVGAALDWRNLPARVEGAIAGRIDHLSAEQRWLLTIASVMGEHFLAEVVAQVAGAETRQVAQILSRVLQDQHRLVEAKGVERLGDQRLTRFRFRHNLMHVYLYAQLDAVQLIYLHEDVAHALEALYGEKAGTVALQLARHYQAANIAEKAVAYLIQAGEQAWRLAANAEAVQHYTQALALLDGLSGEARDLQEFTIQVKLGDLFVAGHGFGAQISADAYTRALALGYPLGLQREIAQVLLPLTWNAFFRGEPEVAQSYGEECLRLAEALQDPELLLLARSALQVVVFMTGRHAEAVAYGEPMIAFYHTHRPTLTFDEAFGLSQTLGLTALALIALGYPERALRYVQEGLALMQRHNHQSGITGDLGLLAAVYNQTGAWLEGLRYGGMMRDHATMHHFPGHTIFAAMHQGVAMAMLGDVDAGIQLLRWSIAEHRAQDIKIVALVGYLAQMGEAFAKAGRAAEGLALAEEALAEMARSNDRQQEIKVYQIKGDLLLLQDFSAQEQASVETEAEACFRRALKLAADNGAKLWEARSLASLCRLLHSQGRDKGCRQQLADLYAWFTEGFETEDLQVVRAVLQETA